MYGRILDAEVNSATKLGTGAILKPPDSSDSHTDFAGVVGSLSSLWHGKVSRARLLCPYADQMTNTGTSGPRSASMGAMHGRTPDAEVNNTMKLQRPVEERRDRATVALEVTRQF